MIEARNRVAQNMTNNSTSPAYTGVAKNYAETHENRIHSDEIAAKFGFEGALVPGVTVFGLTSIPLTQKLGADWLTGTTVHTRFLKPAYDGDSLDVFLTHSADAHEAQCRNSNGVLLCTIKVESSVPGPEFAQFNFALNASPTPADRSAREEISWDRIHEQQPFPARPWHPTSADNAKYASEVDDQHSAFTPQGNRLVHPHLILAQANTVLVDEFEMPAWIHVGSEARLHRPLLADEAYRVFATPTRKWKHKGHEFVTVYMAYEQNNEPVTEVWHTAIYRVAGA